MAEIKLSPDDLSSQEILDYIKSLCKQSYEQGVMEGKEHFSLPYVLKKSI